MSNIQDSIDAFIASDMNVLVIKGLWGVGKTHTWNKYIDSNLTSGLQDKFTAYSSISLFGKSSIADVKQDIFRSAEIINQDQQEGDINETGEEEKSAFFNFPPIKKLITFSKEKKHQAFSLAKLIPQVKAYSEMMEFLEYRLVNNFLVCIDDIERKSSSLSIREMMGLVDELAQKKSCKIVLIFNEASLDKTDQTDFEQYREKIVDLELNYNPSLTENTQVIFSDDEAFYPTVLKSVLSLKIQNIRVIKKVKWVLNQLKPYLDTCQYKTVSDELIDHVVLFCWSYFKCDGALELDFLQKKMTGWASLMMSDTEKEVTKEDEYYANIVSLMNLSRLPVDNDLISLLRYGYLNDESFSKNFNHIVLSYEHSNVRKTIRNAWELYSDSFEDNLDIITAEFQSILGNDLDKVSLMDFDGMIGFLEEYAKQNIKDYVDQYLSINTSLIEEYLLDNNRLKKIENNYLLSRVNEIKVQVKQSLDEISMRIWDHRGWNPSDIEYLTSLDENDYYEWMKGSPDELVGKITSGLLVFRRINTQDENERLQYEKITSSVVGALQRIANESPLNRTRVEKIYAVNVDQTE